MLESRPRFPTPGFRLAISTGMRILIAEDERITLRTLERRLAGWGHEVATAEDGARAWELFQAQPFDAVLTDWQMPEVDGLELIRRIRAAPSDRFVFIILLTSKSEKTDLVAGLEAGANDFLTKPFDNSELQARLNAGQRIITLERELAAKNAAMRADLDAAANYVRSLLPAPVSGRIAVDWRYIPAGDLAGDSLGYHWIDPEHLALYVIDVTGHGLDAAFLSVSVLNVIRTMSLPGVDFHDPAQVLAGLNQRFPMEDHQDRCFTAWYGVYSRTSRQLAWCGGGHPPALLLGTGPEPVELPSNGPLVGMWPLWDGTTLTRPIGPGETLLILSDGAYEIETPEGQEGTWGEFVAAAQAVHAAGGDLLNELLNAARRRRGQPAFEDDFTLLKAVFGAEAG